MHRMTLRRIDSLLLTMIIPWLVFQVGTTTQESSDEYLKKVIQELQTFKAPLLSIPDEDCFDPPFSQQKCINHKFPQNHDGELIPDSYRLNDYQYPRNQIKSVLINKMDQNLLESNTDSQTISKNQAMNNPWKEDRTLAALDFTRSQLAAMYETALQSLASPVKFTPLMTALLSEKTPKVTSTRLEIPAAQPLYNFYFVPLKVFERELRNTYGYKTTPDNVKEEMEMMESQKGMANPLFVAVSTFIGITLVFMVGVLLIPKLGNFVSRNQQDDFLQLARFITEAIDKKNPLIESSRNNFMN